MVNQQILDQLGEFSMDHIGIAVESVESGYEFYQALGLQLTNVEEVPTEGVRVGMISLSNGAKIELLEPTHEESPIAKFLQKRGGGIHHVCLRVRDIGAVVDRLKRAGVRLINETPRPGAHRCQVVFVHPKSTGGVLLELSQPQEWS